MIKQDVTINVWVVIFITKLNWPQFTINVTGMHFSVLSCSPQRLLCNWIIKSDRINVFSRCKMSIRHVFIRNWRIMHWPRLSCELFNFCGLLQDLTEHFSSTTTSQFPDFITVQVKREETDPKWKYFATAYIKIYFGLT